MLLPEIEKVNELDASVLGLSVSQENSLRHSDIRGQLTKFESRLFNLEQQMMEKGDVESQAARLSSREEM